MKLRKKKSSENVDGEDTDDMPVDGEEPLMKVWSSEPGRNADVLVFMNRIERRKEASFWAIGNAAQEIETTPVSAIASVQVVKNGWLHSKVILHAVGNPIELRVPHTQAVELSELVSKLIINASAPTDAPSSGGSSLDELSKLHDLLQAGAISEAEFDEHKARLLARVS